MANLKSVFDSAPPDLGGVYARQGFAYQDDVAARFYIEMLSNQNLVEVSCETYDDIVLIWKDTEAKVAEFVQVKAEHPDQLWSVAKLCEKTKSTKNPKGGGTSIVERNLCRDQYEELSWFRVVTCRQVNSELEVLTRSREHEHRLMSYDPFKKLAEKVGTKVGGFKSQKGNDTSYWLTNACWDVIPENEISTLNEMALSKVLFKMGELYDPDTIRTIYSNLRTLAKNTAEFGVDRWPQKRVSKDKLLGKIRDWIQPFPSSGKAARLERKLTDAGLDATYYKAAKDLQHFYLKRKRSAPYLIADQAENIEHEVLDVLHGLRSSLDSGALSSSSVKFHEQCLKAVKEIVSAPQPDSRALHPGYLAGCMYEITARCRHRFTRLKP